MKRKIYFAFSSSFLIRNKGDISKVLEVIIGSENSDVPRFLAVFDGYLQEEEEKVDKGEAESKLLERMHQAYAASRRNVKLLKDESKEAAKVRGKSVGGSADLQQQIIAKHQSRSVNLFDALEEKHVPKKSEKKAESKVDKKDGVKVDKKEDQKKFVSKPDSKIDLKGGRKADSRINKEAEKKVLGKPEKRVQIKAEIKKDNKMVVENNKKMDTKDNQKTNDMIFKKPEINNGKDVDVQAEKKLKIVGAKKPATKKLPVPVKEMEKKKAASVENSTLARVKRG